MPVFSRVTLPLTALFCILGSWIWIGATVAVVLMFACYLRPIDMEELTSESLVAPTERMRRDGLAAWALLLGARESGHANKSGEFDESVLMDWGITEQISPLLQELAARKPKQSAWSFHRAELTAAFVEAARLGGVGHLEPQLYSLRHGGASADALRRTRSTGEIKKRGRWKSDTSLRRYEKAALSLREEQRVGSMAAAYGAAVEAQLGELLLGTIKPLVPPLAQKPQIVCDANLRKRSAGTLAASFSTFLRV